MVLLSMIALPFLGALVTPILRNKRVNVLFLTCISLLLLAFLGLKGVIAGNNISYTIPLSAPFTPTLQADPLTAIMVLLACLLFLAISIYSPGYMKHEGKAVFFNLASLFTLSSVIGVFLAGDLITLLLFFELMTISSYFWVIHRWEKDSINAGYFYLFYSIIGGLLIALGIVLISSATGFLPNIGGGAITPLNAKLFAWSLVALMVGFGVKGGMVPLHLWLPHAHSVAPTPASALLSGLLIKIGAYGLIRIGGFAGWGQSNIVTTWLGPTLAVLGILTMLIGVMAALLQSNGKKLLAYHSVSQMGYIILGLGIALYLGSSGGFGLIGSIYHIINHALFKAVLFLGVGVIYVKTKETNLYNLGGLWRKFPITAILMLLAVLGITGTPGLNGYASKTILHHAVSQAAGNGTLWLFWLEKLFLVVGVGTAASFAKLYYLIFLGKPKDRKLDKERFGSFQIAMILLTIIMVLIGLNPGYLPNTYINTASTILGMEDAMLQLGHLSFWNLHDLLGMVITLSCGLIVCWAGLKSGFFHWHPPVWLSLEGLGKSIYHLLVSFKKRWLKFYQSLPKTLSQVSLNILNYFRNIFIKINQPASPKSNNLILTGISLDAAILIIALALLIIWYIFINPGFSLFGHS